MAFDLDLDFCKVSSYKGTEKHGKPTLQRFKDSEGFDLPIKPNQRIYIFDDVIDTSETAKVVAEYYEANFRPAELILCTIVNKNPQAVEELKQYYSQIWYGFEVENEWLVGRGMDNPQGFMRQSPSILKMKKYD
jgi:hypoxanthine-guanine phosphoribosyltransferase